MNDPLGLYARGGYSYFDLRNCEIMLHLHNIMYTVEYSTVLCIYKLVH